MIRTVRLVQPSMDYREPYLAFYEDWARSWEDIVPWVVEKEPNFSKVQKGEDEMDQLERFYEDYDEDSRFTRDHSHRTEFLTTLKLLEPRLAPLRTILEVGAGTGAYSVYWAKQGKELLAVDLMQKHVDILRAKASALDLAHLLACQGDARNLSMCRDSQFDAVLCLGPLYHLHEEDDRRKCLRECLRVLKPDGLIAIAYLNRFATLARQAESGRDIAGLRPYLDRSLSFGDDRDVFCCLSPEEIVSLASEEGIEVLDHAATDGISSIIQRTVNAMDELTYKTWLDYHFRTMREPSLLGYSVHGLLIGRKP